MSEIVEIEIVMDDGSIRKGFAKIAGAGVDSAKAVEASFSKVTALISSALAGIAAAFGAKKIIEAGVESEKAWRGFALALASTGQFSVEAANSFHTYAESLQKITGVQDDVIANGARMLLNVGRLSATELPRATKAALDLAAALPEIGGPEGGFAAIAKAAAGSTTALSRFGIHIDETLKNSKKLEAVLKLVETNFAGIASSGRNTFDFMERFAQLGFGEIVKQMGLLVVRSPVLINLLKMMGDAFFNIANQVSKIGGGKDPFKPIIQSMSDFAKMLITFVIRPLEFLGSIGTAIFDGLIVGFNSIVAGLGRIGQLIIAILETVGIKVSDSLKSQIGDATDFATDKIIKFSDQYQTDAAKIGDTPMSNGLDNLMGKMDQTIAKSSEMQTAYTSHIDNMNGTSTAALNEMILKLKNLNEAVTQTIVKGISSAVQTMVKNLHSGKSAFDNFGTMILNLIGDVAIQIGEFFLLAGTGLIALISNPLTAGFTTVAMGLALIAFGALMKSMAGGSPQAAGGGGGDTGGGLASQPGAVPEQAKEENQPKTEVTVVVQGNIFDRRETGLQIAEIINENFDLNGTRLITGAS